MQHVYVIENANGFVKIGVARSPHQRLSQLRISSPVELSLRHYRQVPNPYSVERDLHRHFAHHRVQGEWFKMPARLAIDALEDFAGRDWSPMPRQVRWVKCRHCGHAGRAHIKKNVPKPMFRCSRCASTFVQFLSWKELTS